MPHHSLQQIVDNNPPEKFEEVPTVGDRDFFTSIECVKELIEQGTDIQRAIYFKLIRLRFEQHETKLMEDYVSSFVGTRVSLSGRFLYPPGGYMGWHTNNDAPGKRMYLTYTQEGGMSSFRYFDGNSVITSEDKGGWEYRIFEVSKENPFWHCVYSDTYRYSFGFKF